LDFIHKSVSLDEDKTTSYINPKEELLDKVRVAVITNMATGSSGEVTALAFKGRRNTIFIGEKTHGAMIANVRRNLSFGAFIALTTSYECDRKGNSMKKYFQTLKLLGRTILCTELVCLQLAER
jgi:carboxyl-terminal processing protease